MTEKSSGVNRTYSKEDIYKEYTEWFVKNNIKGYFETAKKTTIEENVYCKQIDGKTLIKWLSGKIQKEDQLTDKEKLIIRMYDLAKDIITEKTQNKDQDYEQLNDSMIMLLDNHLYPKAKGKDFLEEKDTREIADCLRNEMADFLNDRDVNPNPIDQVKNELIVLKDIPLKIDDFIKKHSPEEYGKKFFNNIFSFFKNIYIKFKYGSIVEFAKKAKEKFVELEKKEQLDIEHLDPCIKLMIQLATKETINFYSGISDRELHNPYDIKIQICKSLGIPENKMTKQHEKFLDEVVDILWLGEDERIIT